MEYNLYICNFVFKMYMSNLVYFCLFDNVNNLYLLTLVLESIYIYGCLANNINILIYTSSKYKKIIEHSSLNRCDLLFIENNKYNNKNNEDIYLDILSLNVLNNYKRILYLNLDVLVIDDINILFNKLKDDTVYRLYNNGLKLLLFNNTLEAYYRLISGKITDIKNSKVILLDNKENVKIDNLSQEMLRLMLEIKLSIEKGVEWSH